MHYHYRVDPNIGKDLCAICWIPCACPACVGQLDKHWLPNCAPLSQPSYSRDENYYCRKILGHYNNWIIMEFLENKTPQVELNNLHGLMLVVISTNKSKLYEFNGYVSISANDEAANIFYIVCFTSIPYTLQ